MTQLAWKLRQTARAERSPKLEAAGVPSLDTADAEWSRVIRTVPASVQQHPSQTLRLGFSPASVAITGVNNDVACIVTSAELRLAGNTAYCAS